VKDFGPPLGNFSYPSPFLSLTVFPPLWTPVFAVALIVQIQTVSIPPPVIFFNLPGFENEHSAFCLSFATVYKFGSFLRILTRETLLPSSPFIFQTCGLLLSGVPFPFLFPDGTTSGRVVPPCLLFSYILVFLCFFDFVFLVLAFFLYLLFLIIGLFVHVKSSRTPPPYCNPPIGASFFISSPPFSAFDLTDVAFSLDFSRLSLLWDWW